MAMNRKMHGIVPFVFEENTLFLNRFGERRYIEGRGACETVKKSESEVTTQPQSTQRFKAKGERHPHRSLLTKHSVLSVISVAKKQAES